MIELYSLDNHGRIALCSRLRSLGHLVVLANQSTDDTLNLNPLRSPDKDWFKLRVGRFKSNELRLTIKLLHRRIVSIDKRHDYLTVLGSLLRRYQNDVVVLDVLVD